jgi:hypothetical protein
MGLFKVQTRSAPVPGHKFVKPRLGRWLADEADARALADLMASASPEDRIQLALAVRYGGGNGCRTVLVQ